MDRPNVLVTTQKQRKRSIWKIHAILSLLKITENIIANVSEIIGFILPIYYVFFFTYLHSVSISMRMRNTWKQTLVRLRIFYINCSSQWILFAFSHNCISRLYVYPAKLEKRSMMFDVGRMNCIIWRRWKTTVLVVFEKKNNNENSIRKYHNWEGYLGKLVHLFSW